MHFRSALARLATVAALALACALQPACTSLSGGSAASTATTIEAAASFATSVALAAAVKTPAERTAAASYVWTVASAIRSLSGGQAPTPEQLTATIRTFTKADVNPAFVGVAQALGTLYAGYYPSIAQGTAGDALKVLEKIASGVESAALLYAPGPVPSVTTMRTPAVDEPAPSDDEPVNGPRPEADLPTPAARG